MATIVNHVETKTGSVKPRRVGGRIVMPNHLKLTKVQECHIQTFKTSYTLDYMQPYTTVGPAKLVGVMPAMPPGPLRQAVNSMDTMGDVMTAVFSHKPNFYGLWDIGHEPMFENFSKITYKGFFNEFRSASFKAKQSHGVSTFEYQNPQGVYELRRERIVRYEKATDSFYTSVKDAEGRSHRKNYKVKKARNYVHTCGLHWLTYRFTPLKNGMLAVTTHLHKEGTTPPAYEAARARWLESQVKPHALESARKD